MEYRTEFEKLSRKIDSDIPRVKKFLENSRKIAVIPHWDSDGLASAVLFLCAAKRRDTPCTVILPEIGHYGITQGVKERLEVSECDHVFLTDKELQKEEMKRVKDVAKEILIIDHHDIPYGDEISKNVIVINPKFYEAKINTPAGLLAYITLEKIYPEIKKAIHLAAIGAYCDYAEKELDFFIEERIFSIYPSLKGKIFRPKNEKDISACVPRKLSRIVTSAYFHSLKDGAYTAIQALEKSIEEEDPLTILYGRDEDSRKLVEWDAEMRFEPLPKQPVEKYYHQLAKANRLIFDKFIYTEVNVPYALGLEIGKRLSKKYQRSAFVLNSFDYKLANVLLNGYISDALKSTDFRSISKKVAHQLGAEWFGSEYTCSIEVPTWNAKNIVGALCSTFQKIGAEESRPGSHPTPYASTSSS